MSMESHGGMTSTEKNSRLIRHSSLEILPTESSASKDGEWEKVMKFVLAKHFCSYSQVNFLHVVKSYAMGLPALFPQKEGVLRI
jgi:hypothetical protein